MGALKVVCSIGTTHPWNIAGIGLDARVCAHLGAGHVAVVAGVSAQGSGVFAAEAVAPELIRNQLRGLYQAGIDAFRIGALLSPETVAAVAEELSGIGRPVVCDPVFADSHGHALGGERVAEALRTRLFRHCTLVTPNTEEAGRLSGFPVNDRGTMGGAAHTLVERDRAKAALVTGGHLEDEATDVLYAGGRTTAFEGKRLPGGMRGTGCALASAIAVRLAFGDALEDAIATARDVVREAIAHARDWNGERVWPW